MRVTSVHGDNEKARQLVFERSAAFIELYDFRIGDGSFFGAIHRQNKDATLKGVDVRDVVISLDCWECSNSSELLIEFLEEVAEYMIQNENDNSTIYLVCPDFMEGLELEDFVRRIIDFKLVQAV